MVRHNWGEDRVFYLAADGWTRSLPRAWTDLAVPDPFVTVARGRAPFRLADLLALRDSVRASGIARPSEKAG